MCAWIYSISDIVYNCMLWARYHVAQDRRPGLEATARRAKSEVSAMYTPAYIAS